MTSTSAMKQIDLFSNRALRPPTEDKSLSIEERAKVFHEANPQVLEAMRRIARQRVKNGATRIGVKSLWEELRETLRVQKVGEYKLNNTFTSIYARMLLDIEPELRTFIELRKRK